LAESFRGRSTAVLSMTGALLALPAIGQGQTALSLDEAMARARAATPAARALEAAGREAEARVREARSGYLPRVDVSESVQRGNGPVYVFSSLLSQRRFTEANFAIPSLNDPDAVTNLRAAVTIDQAVFDAGLTRLAVRGAELGRELASTERARAAQDLALNAARAFLAVLRLEAATAASEAAVVAAESDLDRARARRESGLATDADVLAVEVHLADMRGRQIAASGDLAVARIELAEATGLALDEPLMLVRPASPAGPAGDAQPLVQEALERRPEQRDAELRVRLAENARLSARAAYLPRVGVRGGWEVNGSEIFDRRSSWIVGAEVQLNVFRGFGDTARVEGARHAESRADAERDRVAQAIEVDVRAAAARLAAAQARELAGRAALAQARESQRIIRDRYETGVATITDVLRAAEAALDAESRATAAALDVILQRVALDRAVGRL
jgi:outer membrane protein TolC